MIVAAKSHTEQGSWEDPGLYQVPWLHQAPAAEPSLFLVGREAGNMACSGPEGASRTVS